MSTKERRRLVVLERVNARELTVVGAAELLGLSERHMYRICKRVGEEGDAGLVHRLRGRPGNRGDRQLREQAVKLYAEQYSDFNYVHASEQLLKDHGLSVPPQTLRRWVIEAGLGQRRRKSSRKRRRRERRACFGELVQLDGSLHDWFEGRNPDLPTCVLMVMIDDATGWVEARFFESETTQAAMTLLRLWCFKHGLPMALYPDQDSIYRVNGEAADQIEARTGKRPVTQFGRAMQELGVILICARSPQAKGRVERMNGTLQDRLIKEMRLAGISDIDAANRFLEEVFLPALNGKFTVEPAETTDVHRAVEEAELAAALCFKQQRTVGRDHCIRHEGRIIQLAVDKKLPSLAGRKVTVREALDGTLTVVWREHELKWQFVKQRPNAAQKQQKPSAPGSEGLAARARQPWKPPANHPWREPANKRRSVAGAGAATASATPHPPLCQPLQPT